MLHPTYLGYFDRAAAKQRKLVSLAPLDMELFKSKLADAGGVEKDGIIKLETERFLLDIDYGYCLDSVRSRRAAELIAEVATATQCDILRLDTATFRTPDEFLAAFEVICSYREQLRKRAKNKNQEAHE